MFESSNQSESKEPLMTKKQKKTLTRVIITGISFTVLMILDKTGCLNALPLLVKFILYFIQFCNPDSINLGVVLNDKFIEIL